jgi:DNA-binding response OmpR family regulator
MGHLILVIDDAPDVAVTVQTMLQRAGHDVIMAESGRHGLRRFFESRPDLVLLDACMPDLNGWETLERLRDLSDVPVLMLSFRPPAPEQLEQLRPGIDAFCPKPLFGDTLIGTVGDLLAA